LGQHWVSMHQPTYEVRALRQRLADFHKHGAQAGQGVAELVSARALAFR